MKKIVAEIGINYVFGKNRYEFVDNAKKLIDIAKVAECDYVKFQKRNPHVSIPEEQKDKPKEVPWRKDETTYLQYKIDSELTKEEYQEVNDYAKSKNLECFSSVCDLDSVDFIKKFSDIIKIPSSFCNDIELIKYARKNSKLLIISTGMSDQKLIDKVIEEGHPDVVMHTNSAYPSPVEELNLNYINYLKNMKGNFEIGYSGHEYGLVTTFAASAMGAEWIERHITLDRNLWGSDQLASIEPTGLFKLVKGIRDIEKAMGEYGPREVHSSELEKVKTLRKNG